MKKIPVGILGATGMVGQRFITLLANHPWFEVAVVAASPRSAGKTYKEAVGDRWLLQESIPKSIVNLRVLSVEDGMDAIAKQVSFVFSALDMEKDDIRRIEEAFAEKDIPVVSNNSAHRWTDDVAILMPEINSDHLAIISSQQKNHGWKKGFIVVKPNCSIQSYVPLITPLLEYKPTNVVVTTLQAVSGAGKTLKTWPEMVDNVIPFIGGEEETSEKEPMKVWGTIQNGKIVHAEYPHITATCIRVPVNDGHMASVAIAFEKKPSVEQILKTWRGFDPLKDLNLPSSPNPFITVFEEENRPQTHTERELGKGMGISAGRLREDTVLDYKFVGLSHNTIRGAAGGAILTAELLKVKGFIN